MPGGCGRYRSRATSAFNYDAATQLHQTGHSCIAQHFEMASDGTAGRSCRSELCCGNISCLIIVRTVTSYCYWGWTAPPHREILKI